MNKIEENESNNRKILIIEDDKFVQHTFQDGIRRAGFKVIAATNGKEGLQKIKSERPDLVLLDLILPHKTGFEILEEIRLEGGDLKNIPIVILTMLGQGTDYNKCKELGAIDYLIKTDISMKKVIEKIKFHLAKLH